MRRRKINPANRLRLHLSPAVLMRLLSKIVVSPETACWEWQAHTDEKGYGQVSIGGRKLWAHRVFYAVFVRTISDGNEIDHDCRNHSCCNPRHLIQKTKARNSGHGFGRRPAMAAATEEVVPF